MGCVFQMTMKKCEPSISNGEEEMHVLYGDGQPWVCIFEKAIINVCFCISDGGEKYRLYIADVMNKFGLVNFRWR